MVDNVKRRAKASPAIEIDLVMTGTEPSITIKQFEM